MLVALFQCFRLTWPLFGRSAALWPVQVPVAVDMDASCWRSHMLLPTIQHSIGLASRLLWCQTPCTHHKQSGCTRGTAASRPPHLLTSPPLQVWLWSLAPPRLSVGLCVSCLVLQLVALLLVNCFGVHAHALGGLTKDAAAFKPHPRNIDRARGTARFYW